MKTSNKKLIGFILKLMIIFRAYSWCFDQTLTLPQDVFEIDYSPDGSKILFVQDAKIELYHTANYTLFSSANYEYNTNPDTILTGKISKNGNMIAYAGQSNNGAAKTRVVIVDTITSTTLTWIKNIQTGINKIL